MFFPSPPQEEPSLLVTFRLESRTLGMHTTAVHEIVRAKDFTPVHRAPEFVVGIVNLRGRIVTVLDLAAKTRMGKVTTYDSSRIIIVDWMGESVGLLVDEVIDVFPVDADRIAPIPANVSDGLSRYLVGVLQDDEGLIPILDWDVVLSEEEVDLSTKRHDWGGSR